MHERNARDPKLHLKSRDGADFDYFIRKFRISSGGVFTWNTIWQHKLLHKRATRVIVKHSCSNFCCQISFTRVLSVCQPQPGLVTQLKDILEQHGQPERGGHVGLLRRNRFYNNPISSLERTTRNAMEGQHTMVTLWYMSSNRAPILLL